MNEKTATREVVQFKCEPGRDPWHCATHNSAWDLAKRCQKVLGEPEPRKK